MLRTCSSRLAHIPSTSSKSNDGSLKAIRAEMVNAVSDSVGGAPLAGNGWPLDMMKSLGEAAQGRCQHEDSIAKKTKDDSGACLAPFVAGGAVTYVLRARLRQHITSSFSLSSK